MRKANFHMELYLARDVKDYTKGFKYISSKQKTRDSVGLLLNEVGALVTHRRRVTESLLCFSLYC